MSDVYIYIERERCMYMYVYTYMYVCHVLGFSSVLVVRSVHAHPFFCHLHKLLTNPKYPDLKDTGLRLRQFGGPWHALLLWAMGVRSFFLVGSLPFDIVFKVNQTARAHSSYCAPSRPLESVQPQRVQLPNN